jgi:ankyrin repeat protein
MGIVSLLIEKGADINITDSKYGRTPLHQVCFDGTLEAVRHRGKGIHVNSRGLEC